MGQNADFAQSIKNFAKRFALAPLKAQFADTPASREAHSKRILSLTLHKV